VNGPVKEVVGREAIARVLEGVTDTQRKGGMEPGGVEAENFARDVVEQQIKRHEETSEPVHRKGSAHTTSPARLDRGELPDDAKAIGDTMSGPIQEMTPQARRHMFGIKLPLIDMLMLARLNMLRQVPEWDARIQAAWISGEHAAMMSGSELERTDAYRRHVRQTEAVFKVLDESSATFGDWRRPKTNGRTKLIFTPLV